MILRRLLPALVATLAVAVAGCLGEPPATRSEVEQEVNGGANGIDAGMPPWCDDDHDQSLDPICGGCDEDDTNPRVGDDRGCTINPGCPWYMCPPPDPTVKGPRDTQ